MRRLTLCADDFALSKPISETIVELAHANKLTATSCMTVCKGWQTDSDLLTGLPPQFEVGLHLTLTNERPLTAMPGFAPNGRMPEIDPLSRAAIMFRLPLDEIADEIEAQFAAFEDAMGQPPAFVDGHQHAHVLPGIRRIVLATTAHCAPEAWLRHSGDTLSAMIARPWTMKAVGSAFHASGFAAAARNAGLRTNRGFAGHYDFASDYGALFRSFLRRAGHRHLVMCHPGAGTLAGDSIAEARITEANALRRLPIERIAQEHGLELGIR